MRIALLTAFAALCLGLGGCGLLIGGLLRDGMRQGSEESQVVASLARYRQLVFQVDAERLADMFTAKGELSHNAEKPWVGGEQIRGFLKNFSGYRIQDYELRAASTTLEDKAVKQRGTYAQTVITPGGDTVKATGEFDAVWVHEADGRWLLSRMHTSSPVAPPKL